jgi:hypothetical protein
MLPARAVYRNVSLMIALVAAVGHAPLLGQVQDCSPTDLSAAVQPADKVYGPTRVLSQQLERGGFRVRCVLRSHFEGLFEGLAGAALYRTDRGDFEALFLSPPDTFDQLTVNERHERGAWVYSFEGEPKPRPGTRMEGRRRHFVKHAQRLLVVWDDERLAALLQETIARR